MTLFAANSVFSQSLDETIFEISGELSKGFYAGDIIAVNNIESEYEELSAYVTGELIGNLANRKSLTILPRYNVKASKINNEIMGTLRYAYKNIFILSIMADKKKGIIVPPRYIKKEIQYDDRIKELIEKSGKSLPEDLRVYEGLQKIKQAKEELERIKKEIEKTETGHVEEWLEKIKKEIEEIKKDEIIEKTEIEYIEEELKIIKKEIERKKRKERMKKIGRLLGGAGIILIFMGIFKILFVNAASFFERTGSFLTMPGDNRIKRALKKIGRSLLRLKPYKELPGTNETGREKIEEKIEEKIKEKAKAKQEKAKKRISRLFRDGGRISMFVDLCKALFTRAAHYSSVLLLTLGGLALLGCAILTYISSKM